MKLKQATLFTAGHIIGHATNQTELLATSALTFEIVCHYGGPRLVIRVHPVSKLDSTQLRVFLLETVQTVNNCGGHTVSLICDNCPMNQAVYRQLGGPGKVVWNGSDLFLVHDYVHILKNLRNNWITEQQQELSFSQDGIQYLACWKDVKALYAEDRKTALRLTKITHTSVFPKPLQRQSVPLVCQVFNEKTSAAFIALKDKLPHQEGTRIFIAVITGWFKMMNVKNVFTAERLNDKIRAPWTVDCDSFRKLLAMCKMVESARWNGSGTRQKSLTKYTADAFVVTTQFNIAAAAHLLVDHHFK